MKLRKIFVALLFAALSFAVNAGPIVNAGSEQGPERADDSLVATFAGASILDGSRRTATSAWNVISISTARINPASEAGNLTYGGGILDSTTAGGIRPPATTAAAGISEPASLALLGAGLIGIALLRRRR